MQKPPPFGEDLYAEMREQAMRDGMLEAPKQPTTPLSPVEAAKKAEREEIEAKADVIAYLSEALWLALKIQRLWRGRIAREDLYWDLMGYGPEDEEDE